MGQFGLVIRHLAGMPKNLGLILLLLSLLFESCGLRTLANFGLCTPRYWNIKMAHIAAYLNTNSFWWWQCSIGYSFPLPPPPKILIVLARTSLEKSLHKAIFMNKQTRLKMCLVQIGSAGCCFSCLCVCVCVVAGLWRVNWTTSERQRSQCNTRMPRPGRFSDTLKPSRNRKKTR